MAEKTSYYDPD
jgi:hypothetical protein